MTNLTALEISARIALTNVVKSSNEDKAWALWFYHEMSMAYADGLEKVFK